MTASVLAAAGLAAAAVVACVRLAMWWARAPRGQRSAPWRLALLLVAQPLMAALLHLTLFPPAPGGDDGGLVVGTRGSPPVVLAGAGERLIVLPEASLGGGGEPAPDLATALRRHPGTRHLRVVGWGLEPRDRDAAAGLAVAFDPATPLRGLAELQPPPPSAPGAVFAVGGSVSGAPGGSVELVDPSGQVVDARPLSPSGRFVLSGVGRVPGPALFAVRIRDRGRTLRETVDLPVRVAADLPPRALLLAGAAGPEVKALRRWAADVGVDLRTVVAAGAGLELGDPPPPLTAAVLDRLDMVVVDERSWSALSGSERAALAAAVRGGLGLLLRVTGPPSSAVREQWRALGLPLGDGEAAAAVRLPQAPAGKEETAAPDLSRRAVDAPNPSDPALLRDAAGAVLGRWTAFGRGRLGVWSVTDSSGLVTAGFSDRYAELWGALFSVLSRPASEREAAVEGTPREGRRAVLCGVADGAVVTAPDGSSARLRVDPAAGPRGCAGYWPRAAGWNVLHLPGPTATDGRDRLFYVRAIGEAPGLAAEEARLATAALVTDAGRPEGRPSPRGLGGTWTWFLAWLLVSGLSWWLERARPGRPRSLPS